MKAQQRGCFECNRHFTEPTRFDSEGTESSDEPILDAQIGCRPTRTVQDQHLMFGQYRFGYDCPETSGLSEGNKRCDEMDENEQIAHNSSYSGQNPPNFALS
jgi:hypothetical protein